ncbi:MAG TPA: aspartate 1-decarboxylase [Rhizomicrobium sp.]|jgi:aspartate 1-decarboxylase|nr:aspartate 1-decarboxylase [Rhizomicrobium sp.]
MQLTLLKGKIHRATVTQCDLHYEGSISVDSALLERSGILPYEQVDVLDINNGRRFTTYTIPAPAGSGTIGVNGAAARLAQKGDLVIIVAYARMDEAEAKSFTPRVLLVDGQNRPLPPSLRIMET